MAANKIDQLIELQANAGGHIAESRATNFHHFYTRKVLTAKEDISDYRDVTAAEKAALEAADAAFVPPTESAIRRARAFGIFYNDETGFFEYDVLTDLTEADDERAFLAGAIREPMTSRFAYSDIRFNIPSFYHANSAFTKNESAFEGAARLELAHVNYFGLANKIFSGCTKLRKIIGTLYWNSGMGIGTDAFKGCAALEEVSINMTQWRPSGGVLSFADSSRLTLATLTGIVRSAAATPAVTITLHPEAYARLTDELIADGAAKQITFAMP